MQENHSPKNHFRDVCSQFSGSKFWKGCCCCCSFFLKTFCLPSFCQVLREISLILRVNERMVVAVGTACHAQLASIYCAWTEWLHIFVSLWVYLYTLPEVMQFVRVSYLVVLHLAFETRVYGSFGIAWPNAPHRWLVQMTRWSRLAFQSCFRWYAEDLQGLQWLHLHEHCATRSSGDGLLSHYIQCLRFFFAGSYFHHVPS